MRSLKRTMYKRGVFGPVANKSDAVSLFIIFFSMFAALLFMVLLLKVKRTIDVKRDCDSEEERRGDGGIESMTITCTTHRHGDSCNKGQQNRCRFAI